MEEGFLLACCLKEQSPLCLGRRGGTNRKWLVTHVPNQKAERDECWGPFHVLLGPYSVQDPSLRDGVAHSQGRSSLLS